MEVWRIIEHDSTDDYYKKMALDEAILTSVAHHKVPTTLRFYRWDKPAVSIGFFQTVEEEINVSACEKDNVAIFRRMTGGGAVYKDPNGELNYSVVIKESHPLVPKDILLSYQAIEQGVIEGLKILGIQAELSGINDIVVKGKKISGNAQTRKEGVILQHGTVLLDFDAHKMATYLKISKEKLSDKGLKNIEDRVGTLRDYLPNTTIDELEKAVIEGFCKTFDVETELGSITTKEKELQNKLYEEKYSTEEWIYWR